MPVLYIFHMNVFQTITRQICYVNSFYNFKTFTATATNSWNENIIIECKQYHAVNIFFRTWLRRHGGVIRWYRSDYFGKYSVSKLIRADGGPRGYNTPYAILRLLVTRFALSVKCKWPPFTVFKQMHDDIIQWKHFPHYWPFIRGMWIPRTKAIDAELACFVWYAPE